MNQLKRDQTYDNHTFEDIKHIDENGVEYWYARELMKVFNYKDWRYFDAVIAKAKTACQNSGMDDIDHFVVDNKMVEIGSGARREQKDYRLTRYACYLIAQNANPRLKIVALAQTYFAIQTRKQEISEKEYSLLTRKGLRYREDILDNMGSDELIANLFRISQTEQRLKREKIQTEKEACKTHNKVGKIVRKAIKEAGGTLPEEMPTPKKSLKQLDKENKTNLLINAENEK